MIIGELGIVGDGMCNKKEQKEKFLPAVLLGRLALGKAKTITKHERRRRAASLERARAFRWGSK
jgi:hypothetical protein